MANLFLTSFDYYNLHEKNLKALESKLNNMGYNVVLVPVVDSKVENFSHVVAVNRVFYSGLVHVGNNGDKVVVSHEDKVTRHVDYRLTPEKDSGIVPVWFSLKSTYFGYAESLLDATDFKALQDFIVKLTLEQGV